MAHRSFLILTRLSGKAKTGTGHANQRRYQCGTAAKDAYLEGPWQESCRFNTRVVLLSFAFLGLGTLPGRSFCQPDTDSDDGETKETEEEVSCITGRMLGLCLCKLSSLWPIRRLFRYKRYCFYTVHKAFGACDLFTRWLSAY